jgi:hypothetical protein
MRIPYHSTLFYERSILTIGSSGSKGMLGSPWSSKLEGLMSFSLGSVSRCPADILGLAMLRSGGTLFDKWGLTVGSQWPIGIRPSRIHIDMSWILYSVMCFMIRLSTHAHLTPGSRGRPRNTGNKVGRQAPPRILLLVEFFLQVAIGQGVGGPDIRERWSMLPFPRGMMGSPCRQKDA